MRNINQHHQIPVSDSLNHRFHIKSANITGAWRVSETFTVHSNSEHSPVQLSGKTQHVNLLFCIMKRLFVTEEPVNISALLICEINNVYTGHCPTTEGQTDYW